ncbi:MULTISPECIES: branched-chain amino acid ABC transporter substrate-binding protein [Cryobacterium]|uniref:Branched-chain amino acid transport system substrate-binding protein n=2 Tax=Cryobacterium levicorallinum TaxID=995038 RepID=A0ABY1EAF2_9MICO|nr:MULTISPECIES: branched-chain amino acid ABC transporter substrate-binding protein [Cryobacterium]SFH27311.1 branched-chain amino acid transport system substrate-binding protein [Cryobacterium levicorallinum]
MRISKKSTLLLGVATAMLLATSGCSGGLLAADEAGSEETGTVKLAMVVPISGSSAPTGEYMANAAQLAVDEINEAGGVLDGRQLELLVEDEACDAQQGVASANKAVSAGAVVSVGGYCSGATLPQLPIFEEANVPMIIPAANSQDLVNQGLKNVFLVNGTGNQQSTAALEYMLKTGVASVALVDDNDSYSADITAETARLIEEDGTVTLALGTSVTPGESDYSAAVRDIMNAAPELVYWTGYYQEGGLIINQLRNSGFEGDIMVADGSVDGSISEIAGAGAEGVLATMTQTPDTLEGGGDWIASYEEAFGSAPGPFSLQSYDAVRVAAHAIDEAGSTDGDAIIAALEAIDGFEMFSGPLTFTADHTLSNGGFIILSIQDGAFALEDDLS